MNRLNGWPLTAVQSFSVTAGTSVLSAVMEESYTIKDSSQESRVWKSRDFHGFLYMQLLIRPLVRKHGRIVTAAALRIMMAPQCRLINHYSLFSFTRSRHYHHNPILSLHQSHAVEIDGTGYTGRPWNWPVSKKRPIPYGTLTACTSFTWRLVLQNSVLLDGHMDFFQAVQEC